MTFKESLHRSLRSAGFVFFSPLMPVPFPHVLFLCVRVRFFPAMCSNQTLWLANSYHTAVVPRCLNTLVTTQPPTVSTLCFFLNPISGPLFGFVGCVRCTEAPLCGHDVCLLSRAVPARSDGVTEAPQALPPAEHLPAFCAALPHSLDCWAVISSAISSLGCCKSIPAGQLGLAAA